jgi:hypothetical protein
MGKILAYRSAVCRRRDLKEAELFETGLNQAQVIEALAEEMLAQLLAECTAEVDAALDGCSDAVFQAA